MNASETIRESIKELRRQADLLESLLGDNTRDLDHVGADMPLPVFDPDTDQPPVRPSADGSRDQRDWCALLLWGRLRAISVRQGRGATPEESREIAVAAGYRDGRAWNRWELGWEKDSAGNRVFTEAGMSHLNHYYTAVGRALPPDLA